MFVVNLICQSTIIDFVFVSDFQDKDSAFVRRTSRSVVEIRIVKDVF
jgi:hypothetical protein